MKKHLPLSMKRHLPIMGVALATLCPTPLFAKHITPEQAFERVSHHTEITNLGALTRGAAQEQLTIGSLYVFGYDTGYMVLPADDRAPALLAYSEDGRFSDDGNPALRYWLDFYNRELQWLSTSGTVDATRSEETRAEKKAIAPLTKTLWNQEAPYNDLCPKVDGRGTVTGCVATAMAQVLKFYNYPEKGHGTHTYYWEPGQQDLTFDYGATTFEWDQMTDTYDSHSTEEARKAVATLMLACGISVDMHYDVGDSGASTIKMGASLIEYFGYDQGLWMPSRDFYGLYDWEEMVYSELEQGRPVLYSGEGTGGGHQFICDGYRGDGFFHFNWGWGGLSNGYFRLTALNPADLGVGGGAGGFNSGQQIALGVKPAEAGSEHTYVMYCTNHFIPDRQTVSAGQDLKFRGGFFNYSLSGLPDNSELGVKIVSSDGNKVEYIKGFNISGLPSLGGYGEDFFRFPELPDGDYTISPAFYDGKKWHDILAPVGAIGSCQALVTDHTATLSSPKAATVTVTDVIAPEVIFKGRQFPLLFTVVNSGANEFYGDITPVLIDATTKEVVAESLYRPLDVVGESSQRIEDYIGNFHALKDVDFEPGEYDLVFHDKEGNDVSVAIKVKVEAAPEKTTVSVSDFRLADKEPVTDKENVRFTFEVNCEEGYFADRFHIYVFPGDGGYDVAGASSDVMYILAGEKKTGDIVLNLAHLKGGDYMAALYKDGKSVAGPIHFTISDYTGIISVALDDDATKVIYDLNGVRHTGPLTPGIYIVNGIKILVR